MLSRFNKRVYNLLIIPIAHFVNSEWASFCAKEKGPLSIKPFFSQKDRKLGFILRGPF
jgi:hypothetical protein